MVSPVENKGSRSLSGGNWHAGWVGISAGIVNGKRLTSTAAIRDDLINAGVEWVDEEVVQDGKLISSRGLKDLPAFCPKIIAALQETVPA